MNMDTVDLAVARKGTFPVEKRSTRLRNLTFAQLVAGRDVPAYISINNWFHYQSFRSKMAEVLT